MKHPTGYAKPRRLAAPKKKVRLDLKRRPQPEPEDNLETEQKSPFWNWVGLVALFHVFVIGLVYFIYERASTPKPPEQFLSLLPEGSLVKGTPGAQEAHKLGATTPAPAVHHAAAPPPTPSIQPPKPIEPKPIEAKPLPLKPVVKTEAPTPLADKPITPPKPPPPKVPKIKVDLTLVENPAPVADKPVTKPKPHLKKPAVKTADTSEDQDHDATPKADSAGLSKEQIAAKLGDKLEAAGIKNAVNPGTSGSDHAQANPFADFYASIRDQAMDQWQSPNLSDENALAIVHIHVEGDRRVPPESVRLIQSSGNPAFDDSAVAAAKSLGYLHEPLPTGCPPDISITFKPNR